MRPDLPLEVGGHVFAQGHVLAVPELRVRLRVAVQGCREQELRCDLSLHAPAKHERLPRHE